MPRIANIVFGGVKTGGDENQIWVESAQSGNYALAEPLHKLLAPQLFPWLTARRRRRRFPLLFLVLVVVAAAVLFLLVVDAAAIATARTGSIVILPLLLTSPNPSTGTSGTDTINNGSTVRGGGRRGRRGFRSVCLAAPQWAQWHIDYVSLDNIVLTRARVKLVGLLLLRKNKDNKKEQQHNEVSALLSKRTLELQPLPAMISGILRWQKRHEPSQKCAQR